ncbi:hypothetical protein EVY06_09865 [Citrobacter koseri]|uniref:Uncharacterized protein n=1 Tax=Citrobacter koseri TaxID=545 RepID=A0AAQ1A493_CITKO|nr:hypothetical protein CEP66_11945 [Citrobacter koseri]ATF98887.1 hypothetical protein CO700_18500 [Citrobacter koseri]AVE70144.1 hypothetical protein AM351_21210 [Citrobacter koseri]PNN12852.1 hypothetical protein AL526_009095 [Citrobacter koseri]RSC16785.1 hypothetical protein EGS84_07415 [Citrobacter koseri]
MKIIRYHDNYSELFLLSADYSARESLAEIDNFNRRLGELIKGVGNTGWRLTPYPAYKTTCRPGKRQRHRAKRQTAYSAFSFTRLKFTSICGYGKLMPAASNSRLMRSSTSQ